jgi:hypothetical protein
MREHRDTPRPPPAEGPDAITENVPGRELEAHRPPDLTLPFVPTPAVEWEPHPVDTRPQQAPAPPAPPPSNRSHRSAEGSLRDPSRTGPNAVAPAQYSQHTPYPQNTPPSGSGAGASGSYPSASGQRDIVLPRPGQTPAVAPETIPLGYVVVSAFFLAIAVVGFGLYLAFEVISL